MTMTLSPEALAVMGCDPDFVLWQKGEPSPADAHAASAGGDRKRKKPMSFNEAISTVGEPTAKRDNPALLTEAYAKQVESLPEPLRSLMKRGAFNAGAEDDGGDVKAQLEKLLKLEAERSLKPHESGGAYSPFPHDAQAMSRLHEEQVRPFLAALTDQDKLPKKTVSLSSLHAIQPRVDTDKIDNMRAARSKSGLKPPVVARWSGRNYVADGHHRASSAWLDGENSIEARFVDLSGGDTGIAKEFRAFGEICKVDAQLGLVFGYAIVCKIDGQPYFDKNVDPGGEHVPEHIPEDAMLKAAADFMENSRVAKDMHAGDEIGPVVFAFPLTTDIAKSLEIKARKTGLIIAMKPDKAVLAKFASGEYTGFSIGGSRIENEELD